MRAVAVLSVVALVVLAGCSVPFLGSGPNASAPTSGSSGMTEGGGTTGGAAEGSTPGDDTDAASAGTIPPDPANDALGWEGGYWYNESIAVTTGDGYNASERAALVNVTMARVERIRGLEFTQSVPVEVISRADYSRSTGDGGGRSPAFRTFDNAKFEGMFLVGEDRNSLAVQQSNRGQNVLGYYSPANDSIVVVSPTATPDVDPSTLAHELTHALQDQHFDLSSSNPATRDAYNARNGLVEGDANYIEDQYDAACEAEWQCTEAAAGSAGTASGGDGDSTSSLDLGVYILSYFPYADGPAFVSYLRSHGGWDRVNAAYDDLPASAEQVIHPEKYGSDPPTNLTVANSTANGWERVRPPGRPDYAVLGQSALAATFGATLYDDYNDTSVVAPGAFLNLEAGSVNTSDPFNYGFNYTNGWDGDRMAVYRKGNETGYVWKLAWDSPAEAREFVDGYHDLLSHWGGEPESGSGDVWVVRDDSPYSDAFRITRDGNTVTIVNAPETGDLDDVHAGG